MDPMGYLKSHERHNEVDSLYICARSRSIYIIIYNIPLPETNELPVKTGGWKMKFPLIYFQGQAVRLGEMYTS